MRTLFALRQLIYLKNQIKWKLRFYLFVTKCPLVNLKLVPLVLQNFLSKDKFDFFRPNINEIFKKWWISLKKNSGMEIYFSSSLLKISVSSTCCFIFIFNCKVIRTWLSTDKKIFPELDYKFVLLLVLFLVRLDFGWRNYGTCTKGPLHSSLTITPYIFVLFLLLKASSSKQWTVGKFTHIWYNYVWYNQSIKK